MTNRKSARRGVSSVIGMVIMLSLMLLTVASIVSLETAYQFAIVSHGQLTTDKRLENFILIDAFPDGSKVQLMNRGPIAVQIVSIYVNNILTSNVTSCQVQKTIITPCVLAPADPKSGSMNMAWITTQAKLKFGDIVSALSARGNRATATFPIGRTSFTGSGNLFTGTGPLTIIFAPGSFNYTGNPPNGKKIIIPTDAWAGVPAGTSNTMFYVLMVNHGLGDIVLQPTSVLYMNYITSSGPHPPSTTAQFCIVDASSTSNSFVQYNPATDPYIIPDNAAGDLAAGGPPVLVKFAGTGGSSCTSNSGSQVLTSGATVAAVLLGMVYTWDSNLFSQDLPFATLVLTLTPTITLNPSSWFVGTPIAVTGSGFMASSTVTLRFDGNILTTNPTIVTTDGTGAFTATFTVPTTTLGNHIVTATDSFGDTAFATFTVLTSVTQPITITALNGGEQGTGTLSGCLVYPTTILFDGSQHNFTVTPSCALTITVPPDGANTRYRFSISSTTATLTTCPAGSCVDPHLAVYYQILATLSYTIVGGGSPSPPLFTANQLGTPFSQTLTTSGTGYWVDSGSFWSVTNPLSGSSSSERWITATTSGTITAPQTIAFSYYHQFSDYFAYSVSGGGSPTPPTLTYFSTGSTSTATLSMTLTPYWVDAGSNWSTTNPLGGSSGSERWDTNAPSGTVSSSTTQSLFVLYYHQFLQTLSYSLTGGGAPTAPSFSANQFGSSFSQTLTTTATGYWFDSGASWSVTNPLIGSSSTQRWQTTQVVSGVIASAQTTSFTYYHQYLITLQYTISGGGSPSNPTVTFTQFGSALSDTARISSPPSDWIDATTTITYPQTIVGASSERWYTSPNIFTASASVTENPTYYHQYQNTFTSNPSAPTTFDGSITYTITGTFGGASGTTLCTITVPASPSSGSYSCLGYSDVGSVATFPATAGGSAANTRWENAANGPSTTGIISTGGNSYNVNYYKQLQNTYRVTPNAQSTFDSGLTFSISGTYLGSATTIATISPAGGAGATSVSAWADYNTIVGLPTNPAGSSSNTRWQASGATAFTQTTGGNTDNVNYYKQLLNTYQATPKSANWDSGLTISVTGTLLGSAGQTLCTLSPTSGSSSPVSCTVYADYNSAVNYPNTASGAGANIQWLSQAPTSFTQTTGGNTSNVNYYKQLLNTYSANANTPNTFSKQIRFVITGTSLGVSGSTICTINVPGSPLPGSYNCSGYSDANTLASFPSFSTNNPASIQWQARGTITFIDATGGNPHIVQYYEELQNTYAAHPSAPNTFTGSVTFAVGGTLNGVAVTICTITVPVSPLAQDYNCQGYADYNTPVIMPLTSGNNPSPNLRWQLSGTGSFTDTTGGNTHASNYYEQLQNTYNATPNTPGTWDAALNIPAIGTVLGATGQNVCTINTINGGGNAQCTGWSDYNTQVTVTSPVAVSSTERWLATNANVFTDTSGGQTHTVNYNDQFQVSFAITPSGSGTTTPSGTNVYETYGSLSITATPNAGYLFLSWSSNTGSIIFASSTSASTTATIHGTGTITANFALAVTQPITLTIAESGAPVGTFTLSGCAILPTTIVSDGSPHSFTAAANCLVTITVPADGSNTRYRFSSGGTPSTTWTVTTCATGTCTPASNLVHYQYLQTLSYSIIGGGSPSAPIFTANLVGSPFGQVLTSTPTGYWFDRSASWSITLTLGGSTGAERWQTNQATSGTVSSAQTLAFSYYHQYLITLQYAVSGGGTGFSNPTATFNTFGASSSDTANQSLPPSDWIDAGSFIAYTHPLTGSTSSERWETTTASFTATASTTLNPTYYHQFKVTFQFNIANTPIGSGFINPTVQYTQFAATLTTTALQASGPSDWADSGTSVTYPASLIGSTVSEQWATQTTSIPAAAGIDSPAYYHQFLQTLSYSINGGGSPTAPTFSANQFASPVGQTLTTSPTGYWYDAGSSWTITNPLGSSSATERWQTNQLVAGSISSSQTTTYSYTHQYLISTSYSTSDGSTPSPVPTLSGTTFGSTTTLPLTTSSQTIWLDAGTMASAPSTIPTSPSTERWIAMSGTSVSVGLGASLTPVYFHQFDASASYSTSDGSTPSSNVILSGTAIGSSTSLNLTVAPQTLWLDAGTFWSVNNPIPSSPTTERWIGSSGTSGTVTGGITISPLYSHQYLLTINTNPSSVGVGNVTQSPSGVACFPSSPNSTVSCWYASGSTVNLTVATPILSGGFRYDFDHWSGDASGNLTSVFVTMNSALNITANYNGTFVGPVIPSASSPDIGMTSLPGVGIQVALIAIIDLLAFAGSSLVRRDLHA